MTTQKLRAVVTLGGMVDGSLGAMTREFESSARKMSRETGSLTRQQERLVQRIKKAKLAGKDVTALTREYERLSRKIKAASEETARLESISNRATKAQNQLTRTMNLVKTGGTGMLFGGAAIGGLMTMTNYQTAELESIAEGYDMTVSQYKIWDNIAKRMGDGFDGTTIGDLVEELGNKQGEFGTAGEMSKYEDALTSLNLDPKELEKMSAYDRFMQIMTQLDKVKNKDDAKFVSDAIFGGNANRVITYLKNQEGGLSAVVERQKELNLLTDEGLSGAVVFGKATKDAMAAFGSAWQEFSGLLGRELAPIITRITDKFVVWFGDEKNKKALVQWTMDFGRGVRDTAQWLWNASEKANGYLTAIGGLKGVMYMVGAYIATSFLVNLVSLASVFVNVTRAVRGLTIVQTAFNAVMAMNPMVRFAMVFIGVATLVHTHWDGIVSTVTSTIDYLKDKWNEFKAWAGFGEETNINVKNSGMGANDVPIFDDAASASINSAASASKQTITQNVGEIKVVAAPGQTPKEVADAVFARAGGLLPNYDKAGAY